ncbi:unnamed protein product [Prorocentrum cordatum]|uniref:EF-hand domain-containing protein n=1 Tax=Prorocentrum cordatum TaxID=2364126 RepID=A0ABN9YGD8_9DINO|nr:unnamed protein product [Polarella glacialis]
MKEPQQHLLGSLSCAPQPGWRIIVVCTGVAEYVLVHSGVDSGLLSKVRLLRLARMTKLMRMVYHVPFFVELRKLMYMISSCMKTLFWSFLVLGVVMTMWSIVAVELVHPKVLELSSRGQWSDCERCSRAFSTVFHANITFFQTIVAGDSWGLMAIPVIEAHPWSLFIFTGALLTLVFGVLNVIVAVVVDAFAEARAKDVFTRAREMEWDEQQEKKVLSNIFNKIDTDGNGSLDFEELKEGARRHQQFSHLLRVLDIDTRDLEEMFVMLDHDGSGDISTTEFVEWMYRMKNTDSKTVIQFIKQKLTKIEEKVLEQEDTLESRLNDLVKFQSDCLQKLKEDTFQPCLAEISALLEEALQRSESWHRGGTALLEGARGAAEPSVPPCPPGAPLLLGGGGAAAELLPLGGGEVAPACHRSLRVPPADGGEALQRRSRSCRTMLSEATSEGVASAGGRDATGGRRSFHPNNFRSALVLEPGGGAIAALGISPRKPAASRGRSNRRRPSLSSESGRSLRGHL